MPKPSIALVVADSGHARLFLRHDSGDLEALEQLSGPAGHPARRRDGRGRVFESASPVRHAIEGRRDPRARERLRFASSVAQAVNALMDRNACEALVVAAPPRMLRAVRDGLTGVARGRLVHEIARDLTKAPKAELQARLDAVIN